MASLFVFINMDGDGDMQTNHSKDVAKAAIQMALTGSREAEVNLKAELGRQQIRAAAADYGGDFMTAIPRVIERAVVAAKREAVIEPTHAEEGAVAGAAHEALQQLALKAIGLNVGGKVGIARSGDHIAVALFFGVGLLHLDEVALGLGHRAVPSTR
jgi:hypothetical protein